MSELVSTAYAMAPQGGEQAGGSGFAAFVPLILMFAIFYFLLIRPQQKKTKKHQEMLGAIKRDDMVVTTGGLHGKVTGITESIVTLEIAPNVRVKVSKASLAGTSTAYSKSDDTKK